MTYLIWQNLLCLLIAALFGLLLGWLFWGRLARRLRRDSFETQLQLSKLAEFPAMLDDLTARHSSLIAEKEADANKFALRNAELRQNLAARDSDLEHYRMSTFENDALRRTEISQKDAQIASLTARIADLEQLSTKEAKEVPSQHEAELEERLQAATYDREAKDLHIQTLARRIAEIEPLTGLVSQLQNTLSAKESEIGEHVEAHAAKDQQILGLSNRVSELETMQTGEPARAMAAAVGSYSAAETEIVAVERDSDDGQQSLSSAGNSELKQLRTVVTTLFEPLNKADLAQRAFALGKERGFVNGTAQEDWLEAEHQLLSERLASARQRLEMQGLFS